jgi:hypothetical protein
MCWAVSLIPARKQSFDQLKWSRRYEQVGILKTEDELSREGQKAKVCVKVVQIGLLQRTKAQTNKQYWVFRIVKLEFRILPFVGNL